jgi:hypothetical protein
MPLNDANAGDGGFEATAVFDGDESEYGTTTKGEPYLQIRGVTVDTGQEIVERSVMAFGPGVRIAEPLLFPGRPVSIRLRDAGSIMKVVVPAIAA